MKENNETKKRKVKSLTTNYSEESYLQQLPHDLYGLILQDFENLDLAKLSQTSTFFNNMLKPVLLEKHLDILMDKLDGIDELTCEGYYKFRLKNGTPEYAIYKNNNFNINQDSDSETDTKLEEDWQEVTSIIKTIRPTAPDEMPDEDSDDESSVYIKGNVEIDLYPSLIKNLMPLREACISFLATVAKYQKAGVPFHEEFWEKLDRFIDVFKALLGEFTDAEKEKLNTPTSQADSREDIRPSREDSKEDNIDPNKQNLF